VLGVTRYEWGAVTRRASEFEHPRTQRGEHACDAGGSFGREHRRCVHRGQIHLHGRKGRRVLVATQTLYQGLVRDSQAQYEALVVGGGEGLAALAAVTASRPQMLAMPVARTSEVVFESNSEALVKASRPQASGHHRAR